MNGIRSARLPIRRWDALILGAGPAGLMCACEAARRGLNVAVVERQAQAGRKLSLAGGGMGNVTNRTLSPEYYVGENPAYCRAALRGFGCEQILALLAEMDIPWEQRDWGQIFCCQSAAVLARKLEARCRDRGVTFRFGESPSVRRLSEVSTSGSCRFGVTFADEVWQSSCLVLATGSPAWPQVGAVDGSARLVARWGQSLVPWRPVLVPLVLPPQWPLHGLEGISLNVRVTVRDPQTGETWKDPGGVRPLLFTHRGLSGPAALVASCFWQQGRVLIVDFLPETILKEVLHQPENGKMLIRNLVGRFLPNRLAERLIPDDLGGRKTAELSKKDRERLASAIHAHTAEPTDTEGFRRAEAAAGGVAVHGLDSRLQSRLIPGLFFCGELVDVTGLLGGYNLHWAFASGHLVGRALAEQDEPTPTTV